MITLQKAQYLPLSADVDVLVVGGGPAGVGAALAAARDGAETMVVEQLNCLGGVAGGGGHGHISKYNENGGENRRIVGGIAEELRTRLVNEGWGHANAHGVWFEVEGLKKILENMFEEDGVRLLYHTFFCDTVMDGNTTAGVVIQNKTGRTWIKAKRVIDCTGDGDVAYHAGCDWEQGRPADGKCQPVTLMFTIGGVDWPKVEAWRTDYGMKHVWDEAEKKGDMRPFQKTIMGFWWTPTRPDQVGVNFTHVIHVDSTKAEDLTAATLEARKQCFESIDVFRKYVPGMEACHMVSTPNTIGLRESRRIMGDYVINEDDIKGQREFEDNICYGSFFVDIHAIDGPGMDHTTWRPPAGFKYHIPYRSLVPGKVENLMVAGRCLSCTHIALGSLRVMVPCIGMGEAAGTACAMGLKSDTAPRLINVLALQAKLRARNGILSEEDIATANNL